MSQEANVDEKTVEKDVTIIAFETDVKIIAKSSTRKFCSNDNLLCQLCVKNSRHICVEIGNATAPGHTRTSSLIGYSWLVSI